MPRELQLSLSPQQAGEEHLLKRNVASVLRVKEAEIKHIQPLKRSIDARGRNVKIHLKVAVYLNEQVPDFTIPPIDYPNVTNKTHAVIIGAGPAGLFAALRLIELGVKPIVLERGKNVRERRRDLAAINKEHLVNPDSNYCFGEGGAGTYSDGKLYTRSKKRGDVQRILSTLVAFGASPNIMVDAHPHIGTNKLPEIIVAMREAIIAAGGEIHFNTRVTDLCIAESKITGVVTQHNDTIDTQQVILATGHSARDIFELLERKQILIEQKPFAMGVRIEHPQSIIDAIQYKCDERGEHLPPASYSLVHQVKGRGVYSFCMCPGGIIAPCATSPGEVVTNGWSPSKRNNPFANSGIIVPVEVEDIRPYEQYGALAGMRYQQAVEQTAWKAGGQTQTVPAQRLVDFVEEKLSSSLPKTSYQPGVKSALLHEVLPESIYQRLRIGLKTFGKKMRGYYTNEAVLHAVESRTSSPVRIPRDKVTLEHLQIKGLYPCGEGAGYAGGIVSAAIDGEKCAEQCATTIVK